MMPHAPKSSTPKSIPAVQPTAAPVQRPPPQPAACTSIATSPPRRHPYDQVAWELRDAVIQDWKGKLIFEQKNVESPPTGP